LTVEALLGLFVPLQIDRLIKYVGLKNEMIGTSIDPLQIDRLIKYVGLKNDWNFYCLSSD
jgi:hypothetical protein